MAITANSGKKTATKTTGSKNMTFLTGGSVVFDAVYTPGGKQSVHALLAEPDAVHFLNETYRHCKATAITADGLELINQSYIGSKLKSGDTDGKSWHIARC